MIYPVLTPSKKNTVNVPDFTGGINLSENQTDIKDNQLVDAQNLRIDNGVVRTREALTLVPCDNFELSDTEILDATSTVSLYLSNRLANPVGMESELLGYYVNNDYIFKIVLFLDKILAVCVYSEEENETGVTKGNVFEFVLNEADSDGEITTAVNGLNFKRLVLINDGLEAPVTDAFGSIISTNTVTGFITYSDTTDLNYSVAFSLLNADGEFEPSFILKESFADTAYIPTVILNKDNETYLLDDHIEKLAWMNVVGGTTFEDFNLLTTAFKESFFDRKQIMSAEVPTKLYGSELTYVTGQSNGHSRYWNVTLSNSYVIDADHPITVDIYGVFHYTEFLSCTHAKAVMTSLAAARIYLYDDNDELISCVFNNTSDGSLAASKWASIVVPYNGNAVQVIFRCIGLTDESPLSWLAWIYSAYIDRIDITAHVPETSITDNINSYSYAEWFGGARSGIAGGTRLFVAGSASKPNMIRWSALNDVSYFPENNFALIGRGDEPITAIAKQAGFLAVFTPNSLWAVEYAYDTNSSTNATTVYFPTTPISPQFGCDCPNTIQLINDKLTWAHSKGAIYTLVNQNQFSERNVREISAHIRPLLQVEGNNLKTALSADYKGQYIVFAGTNTYVWDYEQASLYNYSSSEKSQERLVFLKWVLPIAPSAVFSEKNSLSIYAEVEVDGQFAQRLFEFDDAESDESIDETGDIEVPITTSFKTKLWDFGLPHIFKRILRLFFGLGSDYDFTASLAYTTDIGAMDSGSTISNEGNFNKGDDVFVIHTNINKTRTVQFEVETDTPIKLNSLQVEYSLLGEVK